LDATDGVEDLAVGAAVERPVTGCVGGGSAATGDDDAAVATTTAVAVGSLVGATGTSLTMGAAVCDEIAAAGVERLPSANAEAPTTAMTAAPPTQSNALDRDGGVMDG